MAAVLSQWSTENTKKTTQHTTKNKATKTNKINENNVAIAKIMKIICNSQLTSSINHQSRAAMSIIIINKKKEGRLQNSSAALVVSLLSIWRKRQLPPSKWFTARNNIKKLVVPFSIITSTQRQAAASPHLPPGLKLHSHPQFWNCSQPSQVRSPAWAPSQALTIVLTSLLRPPNVTASRNNSKTIPKRLTLYLKYLKCHLRNLSQPLNQLIKVVKFLNALEF